MNFSQHDLCIEGFATQPHPVLKFEFVGKFTEQTASSASRELNDELLSNSHLNFIYVWDCTKMTGFEVSARSIWYRSLTNSVSRIAHIYIAASSFMIRGAARIMMEYFNIPYTILKTEHELNLILETELEIVTKRSTVIN